LLFGRASPLFYILCIGCVYSCLVPPAKSTVKSYIRSKLCLFIAWAVGALH
jgi:hypothetical protein